jgi:2-oxoglutarate ferredoxin oxidoreductase subunit beta
VFVFGGDGDGFSIGGNHLDHAGRKNIRLTYVIMDNFVYGLTKKQTSPTSPQGFKSKTDPMGAIDRPTNPMRKLLSSGATFVGRTHASQIKHMMALYERAINHDGFSVVECLSECVEFYKGAFDAAIPRKGGTFDVIDEEEHDVTNMASALALAEEEWPGKFGVYYQKKEPTKNDLEQANIEKALIKSKGASDLDLLKASFAMMK